MMMILINFFLKIPEMIFVCGFCGFWKELHIVNDFFVFVLKVWNWKWNESKSLIDWNEMKSIITVFLGFSRLFLVISENIQSKKKRSKQRKTLCVNRSRETNEEEYSWKKNILKRKRSIKMINKNNEYSVETKSNRKKRNEMKWNEIPKRCSQILMVLILGYFFLVGIFCERKKSFSILLLIWFINIMSKQWW